MNNLIKSVISFWLTTSLISIIIFILLWSLNLTPASWNKYILEVLVNQLNFSISNNIFLPIFGALLCLVVLYLVRVFLKITINISAIILSIIFLIYFSLYLSKSWSSSVLNIKDIAPFVILLCFAAIVLIINQLIYLEKIRLPNFLKRIFRSYFTLSIGVIVILFFQIIMIQ